MDFEIQYQNRLREHEKKEKPNYFTKIKEMCRNYVNCSPNNLHVHLYN